MLAEKNRFRIALIIAITVYVVGVAGMFSQWYQYFIDGTSLIILIMLGLVFYTQQKVDRPFLLFVLICFVTGILSEILFISNPRFFGSYQFGKSLGPLVKEVPWIIGVNWFLVVYCVGIFTHKMYAKVEKKIPPDNLLPKTVQRFSIVIDGAFVATFFDWIMEPAAVKLGYWSWTEDEIPVSNYVAWYVISALLLLCFELLPFKKDNRFAVHLFLLQLLFFLTLRSFL